MERIFSKDINGANYEVFGQYWETRNAWGHNGILLMNGHEIARDRCRYYNRTWESYRFQTAGQCAVRKAMDELAAELYDEYRERTGRARLSQDIKAGILDASPEYRALREVLAAL